jgi:hypothetical protein
VLRANDRQIHLLAIGQREQPLDVGRCGCADLRDPRHARNARIPRGADKLSDVSFGREAGGDRVLACPAANDENSHCLKELWCCLQLR